MKISRVGLVFFFCLLGLYILKLGAQPSNKQSQKIPSTPRISCVAALIKTYPFLNRVLTQEDDTIFIGKLGFSRAGKNVFKLLENAYEDGLKPEDYITSDLSKARGKWLTWNNGEERQHLNCALSRAYVRYLEDLFFGRFNPSEIQPDWKIKDENRSMFETLLAEKFNDKPSRLKSQIEPKLEDYQELKKALSHLVDQRSKWKGNEGMNMEALLVRHADEDYLSKLKRYQGPLETEIPTFQERRQLVVSGKMDEATKNDCRQE